MLDLFAAVGAAIPGVATVQPNRFASAAYLFLVVPAGSGVNVLSSWLRQGVGFKRALSAGLSAVCAISFGWTVVEVAREVLYLQVGHYGALPPEVRPLGEKSRWLLDWLESNTSSDGRILFETSKGRIHDGGHMAGYYAMTSRREFIGGPYPFMFKASAWDGSAFGRPITTIPPAELSRLFDNYNVGWIVVHSSVSKKYFEAAQGITLAAEHDDLCIYRVQRQLSYFAVGEGRVEERGINRLVLTDLKGPEIVIKYHFVRGLSADPPAKVEPFDQPGADQPFVRITSYTGPRVELSVR
jgi:hypothetical protein